MDEGELAAAGGRSDAVPYPAAGPTGARHGDGAGAGGGCAPAPAGPGAAPSQPAPARGTAATIAPAPEKLTFSLDYILYGGHAPYLLAQERGYFAEQGLDVNHRRGQRVGSTAQVVGDR